MKTRLQLVD